MLLGGAQIGLRGITIVSGIILARLLDPRDFGLVTLAQVALLTAGVLAGLGMNAAVIHSHEDRSRVAFHALVMSGLAGVSTLMVVLVFAEPLSELLGDPSLVPILRWMAILLPLTAFTIVPEALLQKELLFGRVSAVVIGTEIFYMGIAIGMALSGFGVWSLVFGSLGKALLTMLLMWILLPGKGWVSAQPWDRRLGGSLLRYGVRTTGSGIVTFVYQMVDNFIVGNKLGSTALGFYGKAMDFTSRTVDGFSNVIGVVLFPSFAAIQTERDRLSRAFLKSLRVTSFVTVPLALGILVTADAMVKVLLGEKWVPMIPALQILALVSLVKPLSASTSALFFAAGRPECNMRAGLVVLVVMLALIPILLAWSFPGIALAVLAAHIVGFAFNVYQVHRVLPGSGIRMLPAIAPALVAGGAMAIAVVTTGMLLAGEGIGGQTLLTLAAMIVVGGVLYASVLYGLQKDVVLEVLELVRHRSVSPGSLSNGDSGTP
jgi:O-antigen/teichoic acid export membrane protein